jgi:hypothetical protein|tara:strand:- start:68 stop:328 length:261 start_codon:yes stop_codon:yes gene_type:complete
MTKNKRVKYYTSENVLEEFYKALASGNEKYLQRVHIPHSSVFYTREAYYQDTGEWITLDRMERSMYLEGMLPAASVFNPKEKRDWE